MGGRAITRPLDLSDYSLPKRRILMGYCKGIGPRGSLPIYILGLWPKPRTKGCPSKRNLGQKRLG